MKQFNGFFYHCAAGRTDDNGILDPLVYYLRGTTNMPQGDKPLGRSELLGPARDFADFCEAEFEQRRNSDAPFDEDSYRKAMEIVLRKLVGPTEPGEA
jgi:hypothetical protein